MITTYEIIKIREILVTKIRIGGISKNFEDCLVMSSLIITFYLAYFS